MIPDSVKERIKKSEQYKEYETFKENLKEYASTREGVAANVGTTIYSHVAQGSPMARAQEMMRKYVPDFSIYDLEQESTVIFKNAYHSFLSEKLSELELIASDQAYEFYSAYIKMLKTKVVVG